MTDLPKWPDENPNVAARRILREESEHEARFEGEFWSKQETIPRQIFRKLRHPLKGSTFLMPLKAINPTPEERDFAERRSEYVSRAMDEWRRKQSWYGLRNIHRAMDKLKK